jgi:hypothetical protein
MNFVSNYFFFFCFFVGWEGFFFLVTSFFLLCSVSKEESLAPKLSEDRG